jgi:flagellar hook-associated protein 2
MESLLSAQRTSRIAPLENRLQSISGTSYSLNQLDSKLTSLNQSLQSLRSTNGGVIERTVSSSNQSVLTVNAGASATNTSASIQVSSLASNGVLSFDNTYDSLDTKLTENDFTHTVEFTLGTGDAAEFFTIESDSNQTVASFIAEFNKKSARAVASAVNVGTDGTPQYKIVINSLSQGTEQGSISAVDVNELFKGQTLDQATDAQLTVSGISGTITRSSNTVTDIFPGLTFNLSSTGSSNITVTTNTAGSVSKVQAVVDKFNDLVGYLKEANSLTSGANGNLLFGPLARTSIDENILSALRSGISNAFNTGSDFGISTEMDGTLSFNTNTFSNALTTNPAGVTSAFSNFGESAGSTNGIISSYTKFGGIIDIAQDFNRAETTRTEERIRSLNRVFSGQEQQLRRQYSKIQEQLSLMESQSRFLQGLFSRF